MSVDPHEHHQLVRGPTSLGRYGDGYGWRWFGTCKCGQDFRGVSEEDIYVKAQTHINRHNYHDDENGAA